VVFPTRESKDVLIAIEVKITERRLDALVGGMRACAARPVHNRKDCGDARGKAYGLMELHPRFFLTASSTRWRTFEVGHPLDLNEVAYLPHPIVVPD
jgi:hypothetical protein